MANGLGQAHAVGGQGSGRGDEERPRGPKGPGSGRDLSARGERAERHGQGDHSARRGGGGAGAEHVP